MINEVILEEPLPIDLLGDFRNKLHYVAESLAGFEVAADGTKVTFRLKPGTQNQRVIIADRISEVARKMCAGRREKPDVILATQRPDRYNFSQNPHSALLAADELYEYGPGRFSLGPIGVRLIEWFERDLRRVAAEFAAEPRQFPSIVGADVLHRCRYLQSFPHSLALVSHLREDLDAIARFAKESTLIDGVLHSPSGSLAEPKCLLAPTICFHCYAWLAGRNLTEPRTITAVGKCFRYESGAMATLERLWDFSMREIIFVGPAEYCLNNRERCVEVTKSLLDKWQLGYEIRSATDPFFIDSYGTQTAFQQAFELKFEIRADLPYEPGKSLAVGSFNFHQDFFGRALAIGLPDGKPTSTACVGYGLERLAWAFLCQHGPRTNTMGAGTSPCDSGGLSVMTPSQPSTAKLRELASNELPFLRPLWEELYTLQREQGMRAPLAVDGFEHWTESLARVLGRFAVVLVAVEESSLLDFSPPGYARQHHRLTVNRLASSAKSWSLLSDAAGDWGKHSWPPLRNGSPTKM